jgi:hypothetical protein
LPLLTEADLDEIYRRIGSRHVRTIQRHHMIACGVALRRGSEPSERAFMAALVFERPRGKAAPCDETDPCGYVVTRIRPDGAVSRTRRVAQEAFIAIKGERLEAQLNARTRRIFPSDNPGHRPPPPPPAFNMTGDPPRLPRYRTKAFPPADATHRDACIKDIAKRAGRQIGREDLRDWGRPWLRAIQGRDCPTEAIVRQFEDDPAYADLRRPGGAPKTRE